MNVTDLRRVLDENSAGPAGETPNHLRLRGVRTKVVARRRRRMVAAAAATVAVLAGAAVVAPRLGVDTSPDVSATPSPTGTVEGFQEYQSGFRVVGAKWAPIQNGRIELTITPSTLDLAVVTRCEGIGDRYSYVGIALTSNGRNPRQTSCGATVSWHESGLAVGEPATFVFTAGRVLGPSGEDATLAGPGMLGVAIGEQVAFEDYPLPPRPSGPLRPLEDKRLLDGCRETPCPEEFVFRSDPEDPRQPLRRIVSWRTVEVIDMISQTPGILKVRVNGRSVATGRWWTYEQSGYGAYGDEDGAWAREFGLSLRPGDPVTIEILPDHVTGAWTVVFAD